MTPEKSKKEIESSRFSTMISPEDTNNSKRKIDPEDEKQPKLSKRQKTSKDSKFIYGNYDRYYGYRKGMGNDPRITIFEENVQYFKDKSVLDIGCNDGSITLEIASELHVTSITGIDIDRDLIQKATKNLKYLLKKSLNTQLLNVTFDTGNYLSIESTAQQFDTILCLSVTKWIHLNFGDDGIKKLFKNIFNQLRPGGSLILEAQPYESYKRRKKLTSKIYENYNSIKLFPKDFKSYLMEEIGFTSYNIISESKSNRGFDRPIEVFTKAL